MTQSPFQLRRELGFSLVELLVAVALGLLLTIAMAYAYLNSKIAFSRQQQLSSIQQGVRIAFEYLSSDIRMVGHLGCFTGSPTTPNCSGAFCNLLPTTGIATNFGVGIEGYEYKNSQAGKLTLASNAPADDTDASHWETNVASGAVNAIPLGTIAGNGLTPGSDVLVIRTVSGRPVRLAANANVGLNQATLSIETTSDQSAKCSGGTVNKVSGFCTNSYGLVASCTRARVFQVDTITPGATPTPSTLTIKGSMGNDPSYSPAATEVFPMQTVAYYVKRSSSGTSTSLYRRVFDGDNGSGLEQELIEGVETLQVTYGTDTSTTPDGAVDQYVVARGGTSTAGDSVMDWSRVVAVRMSLLIRSTVPVESDVKLSPSGMVNGVEVTYPSIGPRFDRRVFTTTVAVRNKIAYF